MSADLPDLPPVTLTVASVKLYPEIMRGQPPFTDADACRALVSAGERG
jgi:hypothetical protein